MNRILPLLSLPLLSLAAAFAANTPEHIGNDLKLFKDSSCTSPEAGCQRHFRLPV